MRVPSHQYFLRASVLPPSRARVWLTSLAAPLNASDTPAVWIWDSNPHAGQKGRGQRGQGGKKYLPRLGAAVSCLIGTGSFSYVAPLMVRTHGNKQIFTNTKVLDIRVDSFGKATRLSMIGKGGQELEATLGLTLLNLPRNHLLELPSVKSSLSKRMLDTLRCVKFDLPPDVYPLNSTELVGSTALTKAYLYFKEAWWRTKLNKTSGTTPQDGWLPLVRLGPSERQTRQLCPWLASAHLQLGGGLRANPQGSGEWYRMRLAGL